AYDFVFCRNLLIYFDVPTQEQVLDVLKRLSREDGVLFVGPAEASLFSRVGLQSLGIPLSFAFRRQAIAPAPMPVVPPPVARRPTPAVPAPAPRPVAAMPLKAAPAKAPVAVDNSAEQLAQIAAAANGGRTAEARRLGEAFLASHGLSAEVFYWLGLLCEVENDPSGAQGFYRKALYPQPQHPAALAQMAALLAAGGDKAGAQRLQARAQRGAGRNE
ncbi:MAG: CheR family methyltransferase, partial [Pseudomonas sp.]